MTPTHIDALLVEPMARALVPVAWQAHDAGSGMITEYRVQRIAALQAARAALTAMRAALTANGLFIGPEAATEGMQGAMVDVFGGNGTAGEMWEAGVAEWQRGGGA